MKRIIIALFLCPLFMIAGDAPKNHYTMTSQPDNARVANLKLTLEILDKNPVFKTGHTVLASYIALFKQVKNGISNLAPVTVENPISNGYDFTSCIQKVDFQKHMASRISIGYMIEKDGLVANDDLKLTCNTTHIGQDPMNEALYIRALLSEIKE